MSVPQDLVRDESGIGEWCILHGYRGSIAHGMYEPNHEPGSIDDKDTMAVCVPPVEYYYGLAEFGSRGTREIVRDPWDIVVYEARKMIRLLAQGNPNVFALLWLPDNLYITRHAGQEARRGAVRGDRPGRDASLHP
jgi:predicted nucleotidyltransferase